ncbi:hypothetical protein G6F32_013947 [Rhizopus arrhizus]|nr:hypothetical protein G6F32_013947 [Rhizopus arrhizus]
MHHDRAHQHPAEQRMGQHREADHPDREEVAEVLPPDHEAGQQQRRQAADDGPEQQLLAGIEAAHRRQLLVLVAQHIAHAAQPRAVVGSGQVVAPHAEGQQGEADHHGQADERVQDARPRPAAEQLGQRKQGRVEHRQPGQRGQHEADRHDPVVDAGRRAVADDLPRVRCVLHGRCSSSIFFASCSASSSSSSFTVLRPIPM